MSMSLILLYADLSLFRTSGENSRFFNSVAEFLLFSNKLLTLPTDFINFWSILVAVRLPIWAECAGLGGRCFEVTYSYVLRVFLKTSR